MTIDLTTLELQEIYTLQDDILKELKRREAQPLIEEAQAQVVKELQDAGQLSAPEAAREVPTEKEKYADVPVWQDPGTEHHKMYRPGDIVRFGNKLVRSTHKGLNHWSPGTLGYDGRIWEIIETEGDHPEIDMGTGDDDPEVQEQEAPTAPPAAQPYRQPTGAHDAYKQGDQVTYNGAIYESTIPNNVWAPDAHPQGWKKVG